ncbi:MAG: hypothetical protein ACRYG2_03300, partial [Janthinobacterium lividum]
HDVEEDDRVIFAGTVSGLASTTLAPHELPSFEPGGPRRRLFFPPGATRVGIVTCGGLCPGLDNVIRGLVGDIGLHLEEALVAHFAQAGGR